MGEFIDFLREHGLDPSVVRQITIADWGRSVDIRCAHNPYGAGREYSLRFRGCSQVSWEAHTDALEASESETDILGLEIQAQRRGIQPYREGDSVAVLATAALELIISYATFRLDMH